MKARLRTSSLKHQPSAGFTLVEMLVVTVILVILMSLISMAVFSALEQARITRVALEGQILTQAFQTFATTKGVDFPPSDLRPGGPLLDYVQGMFSRYDAATNLYSDLAAEGVNVTDFDPGYAMVFWLIGFSDDPTAPFSGHAERMGLGGMTPDLEKAHYDFDTDRLRFGRYFPPIPGDVDNLYTFNDSDSDGVWDAGEAFDGHNAFLYFDASSSYGGNDIDSTINDYQGFRPYRNGDTADPHYNNNSIQIISAGLDKKLGHGTGIDSSLAPWQVLPCRDDNGNVVNAGKRCEEDADNIANFSGGQTILEFAGE